MRLLYVVHQFFPEAYSGTEQYVLAAAREGRRRGHDVTILSLLPWFEEREPPVLVYEETTDGFRVVRVRYWKGLAPNDALRDYRNPFLAETFDRILADARPNAVHFFHLRGLDAAWIGAASSKSIRAVVHLMDFWFVCPKFILLREDGALCEGPPEGGLGCVPCARPERAAGLDLARVGKEARALLAAGTPEKLPDDAVGTAAAFLARPGVLADALSRADVVISPSRFVRDVFARNGIPPSRIRVVPYGIESGRVSRAPVARPRKPLRVAFLGVLSPWKAPHLLVEAAKSVSGEMEIALHGRVEEPMFRDYIERLRAAAAADPRVRFAGEFPREKAGDVFAQTDLLVVPSLWYENTPFVVLEAFAAGVPVAASNVGGMSEIVEEGRNGFLFERGSSEGLAQVLRRCFERPEILSSLCPEPLGSIERAFDRFEEAYRGG